MNFDWAQFLTLAKELSGDQTTAASDEARLRSAASRAYYAAFRFTKNYLRDTFGEEPPDHGNNHAFIIQLLKASSAKDFRRIGINLERLRDQRNQADYDDEVDNIGLWFPNIIHASEKIIQELPTISNPLN